MICPARPRHGGGTLNDQTPQTIALPEGVIGTLQRELATDEQIVWCTQPRMGARYRMLWFISIFGLPFLLIGLAISLTGVGACIGLPFALVGGTFVFSRVLTAAALRRTVYAVTNKRALAIEGRFFGGRSTTSYPPTVSQTLERVEYSDGTGDLIFRSELVGMSDDRRLEHRGFLSIPDVRGAESALRAIVASPSRGE